MAASAQAARHARPSGNTTLTRKYDWFLVFIDNYLRNFNVDER